MAFDPNQSPVGWYIGSYLCRFIVIGEDRNDDPDRKFTVWENTVLVEATNLEGAYDKVVSIGRDHEKPYKNALGQDVQWMFEGVSELSPVYEELKDGCEVMWASYTKKLRNIRRGVSTKLQVSRERLRPSRD